MDKKRPPRYDNILRLLAMLSLDGHSNYGDVIEQHLSKISDDEMFHLLQGNKDQIKAVVVAHKLPPAVIDLICILLEGVTVSNEAQALSIIPVQVIPPKNKLN